MLNRAVLALLTFILVSMSFAQANKVISEDRLNECYKKFPFFIQSLMLIGDDDFKDAKKSQERKAALQVEFAKKPAEIRACLDDIILYSKKQNDADNTKFVIHRMSEISGVAYKANADSKDSSGRK